MRVVLFGIFCSLFFVACNNKDSKNDRMLEEALEVNKTEMEVVGDDVDKHGCKSSAGYTWSQLHEDCIRIFDEGITLLPVKIDESEPVFAAFVLYSEDKTQVELFLPSEKESVLLPKSTKDHFVNDVYSFDDKNEVLYINGNAKYKKDKG